MTFCQLIIWDCERLVPWLKKFSMTNKELGNDYSFYWFTQNFSTMFIKKVTITSKVFTVVCFFILVDRSSWEFFPHKETSPLQINGFRHVLGIYGRWGLCAIEPRFHGLIQRTLGIYTAAKQLTTKLSLAFFLTIYYRGWDSNPCRMWGDRSPTWPQSYSRLLMK